MFFLFTIDLQKSLPFRHSRIDAHGFQPFDGWQSVSVEHLALDYDSQALVPSPARTEPKPDSDVKLRCVVGAVAPGDLVGRTRNHARSVGGKKDHPRRQSSARAMARQAVSW